MTHVIVLVAKRARTGPLALTPFQATVMWHATVHQNSVAMTVLKTAVSVTVFTCSI